MNASGPSPWLSALDEMEQESVAGTAVSAQRSDFSMERQYR